MVFSMRLSEEDVEFLRSLTNATEFIHVSREEERRKRRMMEAKGLPYEIIHEIAEYYVKNCLDVPEDPNIVPMEERDEKSWLLHMQRTLFRIAELTLKMPNYYTDGRSVSLPDTDVIDELQSREAKDFIKKIRENVEQGMQPLSEDVLDIIKKIYEEAKFLLEKEYRRNFHKIPPANWHLYVDLGRGRGSEDIIHYKTP
jgi:hypothetical protein